MDETRTDGPPANSAGSDGPDGPPAKRRPGRPPKFIGCQVCGCSLDDARMFHKRYHICEQHMMADILMRDGVPSRFCQQCAKFHPIENFEPGLRSCRAQLARHAARRRKNRTAQAAFIAAAGQAAAGVAGAAAGPAGARSRGAADAAAPAGTTVPADAVSPPDAAAPAASADATVSSSSGGDASSGDSPMRARAIRDTPTDAAGGQAAAALLAGTSAPPVARPAAEPPVAGLLPLSSPLVGALGGSSSSVHTSQAQELLPLPGPDGLKALVAAAAEATHPGKPAPSLHQPPPPQQQQQPSPAQHSPLRQQKDSQQRAWRAWQPWQEQQQQLTEQPPAQKRRCVGPEAELPAAWTGGLGSQAAASPLAQQAAQPLLSLPATEGVQPVPPHLAAALSHLLPAGSTKQAGLPPPLPAPSGWAPQPASAGAPGSQPAPQVLQLLQQLQALGSSAGPAPPQPSAAAPPAAPSLPALGALPAAQPVPAQTVQQSDLSLLAAVLSAAAQQQQQQEQEQEWQRQLEQQRRTAEGQLHASVVQQHLMRALLELTERQPQQQQQPLATAQVQPSEAAVAQAALQLLLQGLLGKPGQ